MIVAILALSLALVILTPRSVPHYILADCEERWEPGRFVIVGRSP